MGKSWYSNFALRNDVKTIYCFNNSTRKIIVCIEWYKKYEHSKKCSHNINKCIETLYMDIWHLKCKEQKCVTLNVIEFSNIGDNLAFIFKYKSTWIKNKLCINRISGLIVILYQISHFSHLNQHLEQGVSWRKAYFYTERRVLWIWPVKLYRTSELDRLPFRYQLLLQPVSVGEKASINLLCSLQGELFLIIKLTLHIENN